jgi:hypothetical protein
MIPDKKLSIEGKLGILRLLSQFSILPKFQKCNSSL